MKHSRLPILAVAVCAAAFVGGLLAGRGPAATEAVRTVDFARILEEFEPFNAAYQEMMDRYRPEFERLRQNNEHIKLQRGELATMDENSDAYRVRKFEIEVQEKSLSTHIEFWNASQRRDRARLLQRSVTRIHEACAEYGRRTGVSAVLMKPGTLPGETEDTDAVLRELESRWVVWAHEDHDVTEQVLAILRENS